MSDERMSPEERSRVLESALHVKAAVADRGFATWDEYRIVARDIIASGIRSAEAAAADEALERAAALVQPWCEEEHAYADAEVLETRIRALGSAR